MHTNIKICNDLYESLNQYYTTFSTVAKISLVENQLFLLQSLSLFKPISYFPLDATEGLYNEDGDDDADDDDTSASL